MFGRQRKVETVEGVVMYGGYDDRIDSEGGWAN